MKLNLAERLLVNNHARAAVQMFYEGHLLRRLGGTVQGGTVLEIGCGRGAGIEVIFRHFGAAHVCGLDLDPLQIERARKRLESKYAGRVSLTHGDAEQLPFADASFNAVFDFGALHHVPNWQRSLRSSARSEAGREILLRGSYAGCSGTLDLPEVLRTSGREPVQRIRISGGDGDLPIQISCSVIAHAVRRYLYRRRDIGLGDDVLCVLGRKRKPR